MVVENRMPSAPKADEPKRAEGAKPQSRGKKVDPSEALLLQMPSPITNMSQATELLKAKKMMVQVQEELDQCKANFHDRMLGCRQREEELAKKQEELRKNVTNFSVFMKENDAKRLRSSKKAAEEIKQRELKEKEIEKLNDELEKRRAKNALIQRQVNKYMEYQQCLERVLEHGDEFHEIGDVLQRHKTLKETEQQIQRMVTSQNSDMDQLRKDLGALSKEMQNSVLVQNSLISKHQKMLEAAKQETAGKEQDMIRSEGDAKERKRRVGETRMSIMNLWKRCADTSTQKVLKQNYQIHDTGEQPDLKVLMTGLTIIEQRMKDLMSIAENEKHHAKQGQADAKHPA